MVLFPISIFWALLAWENGRLKTWPKDCPTVRTFWFNHLKNYFYERKTGTHPTPTDNAFKG